MAPLSFLGSSRSVRRLPSRGRLRRYLVISTSLSLRAAPPQSWCAPCCFRSETQPALPREQPSRRAAARGFHEVVDTRAQRRAHSMKWLTHESAEGLLAITSLARSLGGDARLSDVGGLLWMILRQSVPWDAMASFLIDEDTLQL